MRILTLILLTIITAQAQNPRFCKGNEDNFNSYIKSATVAYELRDNLRVDKEFDKAKDFFYNTITSDCIEHTNFKQMKATMAIKLEELKAV